MLRNLAVGELNLTLMQYYDRTLFELSVEIEGYNRRWEEDWRKIRKLYTPLQNAIVKKPKTETDWIPLPSDQQLDSLSKFQRLKERVQLEHSVKNGS